MLSPPSTHAPLRHLLMMVQLVARPLALGELVVACTACLDSAVLALSYHLYPADHAAVWLVHQLTEAAEAPHDVVPQRVLELGLVLVLVQPYCCCLCCSCLLNDGMARCSSCAFSPHNIETVQTFVAVSTCAECATTACSLYSQLLLPP